MSSPKPPRTLAEQSRAYGSLMPSSCFNASAPSVARALIGAVLVHQLPDGARVGRIVETEAYDATDPASHSFRGPASRTQAMFGPGGHAYVYRSYGIHWCLNISCGPIGWGAAVLIRAMQPLAGLDAMAQDRGLQLFETAHRQRLCQGPGNVTQALGITATHNTQSMRGPQLFIHIGAALHSGETIEAGPRIGISVAQQTPWRFYVARCPFVSGRRGRKVSASRQV